MKRIFAASFVFSLFVVGCGAPAQNASDVNEWGASVAEGRREAAKLRNMTDAEEAKYGAEIDAMLKDPQQKKAVGITISVSQDPVLVNLVNRVGQRVAQKSVRNNIPYSFQVVNSDDVNAFATMGGFVYVNKGLIVAAENEAQLAGVIAHEVAHIAKKHAIQGMAKQIETAGWGKGVGGGLAGTLIQVAGAITTSLPKSRAFEFQADELAFLNVRDSGYAADEMIEFYGDVLAKLGAGSKTPVILRTHPETTSRISMLKRLRKPSDAVGDGNNDDAYRSEVKMSR